MKIMGVISFRIDDKVEQEIKQAAKKRKMTISQFVANRIFSDDENFQNDNFLLKQKVCEIEKQQHEIILALVEMTKRIRLSANVSISILQKINPDGWQKEITKIEKSVEVAMAESGVS